MGPVNFTIKNDSGLSLLVMNSIVGNIGGCASGEEFNYQFDSSFTNNTNAIRFFNPSTPGAYTDVSGASWSEGGSGFDPGWQSPFTISASGDYNGVEFSATSNGWIELQPWNLMINGGSVNIHYYQFANDAE